MEFKEKEEAADYLSQESQRLSKEIYELEQQVIELRSRRLALNKLRNYWNDVIREEGTSVFTEALKTRGLGIEY